MVNNRTKIVETPSAEYKKRNLDKLIKNIKKSLAKPIPADTPKGQDNLTQLIITEIKKKQRKANALPVYDPQSSLDLKKVKKKYQIIVNDDTVDNPFVADEEQIILVNNQIKGLKTDYEKAHGIYEWMERNIPYDSNSSLKERGYLNSRETLRARKGICTEMTFLYVTMARSAGLFAKVADVYRDDKNKKVNHTCAAVSIDGLDILVDVAYHTFDIKHKGYRLMSDKEVIEHYNSIKKRFFLV